MAHSRILTSQSAAIEQMDAPHGKKAALLAALKLFSTQGYDKTSTVQIAQDAGISQATVFKYFPTKQDLLLAVIEPIGKQMGTDLSSQFDTYDSLEDYIRFIITDRTAFFLDNTDVIRILYHEALVSEYMRSAVVDLVLPIIRHVAPRIVEIGKKDPTFDDSMTIEQIQTILTSQFLGMFMGRFIFDPNFEQTPDLEFLTQQTLKQLRR